MKSSGRSKGAATIFAFEMPRATRHNTASSCPSVRRARRVIVGYISALPYVTTLTTVSSWSAGTSSRRKPLGPCSARSRRPLREDSERLDRYLDLILANVDDVAEGAVAVADSGRRVYVHAAAEEAFVDAGEPTERVVSLDE